MKHLAFRRQGAALARAVEQAEPQFRLEGSQHLAERVAEEWPSDELMMNIAVENNLSKTALVALS